MAATIKHADEQSPTGCRNLTIYVLGDRPGCADARRLAADLGGSPADPALAVEVRLVDLAAPGADRPPAVFAVPTYLLDGRLLSLGTPNPAWLRAQLAAPSTAGDDTLAATRTAPAG